MLTLALLTTALFLGGIVLYALSFVALRFTAKHRGIWPVAWLCEALDVSRSGFHAWLNR
jgi:hypothetical protein